MNLRAPFILLLISLNLGHLSGQEGGVHYYQFSFSLEENDYSRLISARGSKFDLYPTGSSLNGVPVNIERLHIRGKSSLFFDRKSFSIHTSKEDPVNFPDLEKPFRKFNLLSLSMDKNFFRNRLAFRCLNEFGLFPLFNAYANITINQHPQGIYLIMEKPDEYVLNSQKGVFLLRSMDGGRVEYEGGKELSGKESRTFVKAYREISKICKREKGEILRQELSERLDLEAYMKWLAFNFWIKNGDYGDEFYLYVLENREKPFFHLLPWDYDDIFSPKPHEGQKLRDYRLGPALIFSSEDMLGRTIATDSVLYTQYCGIFKSMLEDFTEEKLEEIFAGVLSELQIYAEKQRNDAHFQPDRAGMVDIEAVQKDMASKLAFLKDERLRCLAILNQ